MAPHIDPNDAEGTLHSPFPTALGSACSSCGQGALVEEQVVQAQGDSRERHPLSKTRSYLT